MVVSSMDKNKAEIKTECGCRRGPPCLKGWSDRAP